MNDEDDLIDVTGVPELFFDGVSEIKIIEGVVRLVLYSRHGGTRTVVAKLAIPISELPDVIQTMVMALTTAAKTIIKPMLS